VSPPRTDARADTAQRVEPSTGPPARRGIGGLLVDPYFGGVFWGKFLSFAGVMIQTLVTSIMAFEATGSALAVALVSAAIYAPQIVVGPWSGAVADRGFAVAQIIVGRAVCGVGVGAMAVWAALADRHDGWSAVAVMAASAAVSGIGLAIGGASMNSLVPQLVTRDELPLAMSLNTVPVSVARVAGPMFGALVLAASGPVAALWSAAAGHVLFAVVVLVIRPPEGPRRARSREGNVRAAWSYVVRRDPVLLRLLVATAFVGFGSEPVFVLAPSYADGFGGGATLVAVLSASFGVGAALGLWLSILLDGRQPHARAAWLGFLLMMAGSAACGALPWLATAYVAFGLTGLGFTLGMAGVSTQLQLRVPNELRGRVMALWMVAFVGVRPVTAMFVGAVAEGASERVAFGATAVVMALAAWWCRPAVLTAGRAPGP
jgi:MFS family permease